MRSFLFISLVLTFFIFGGIKTALAQSATSTVPVAANSAALTAGASLTPSAGMPEWSPDLLLDTYIWGKAASLINAGVSQLAPVAEPSLPMPILFGVAPIDLTPNFGDPRGSGRFHEGEDIMAPKGALVVSSTSAVVLSVGYGADSGNYVTTTNPGGETFVYMHLDRMSALAAGALLQPGSLIGFAGNTGNAAGGAAHLHFEIRKNGATNPFIRLKSEFTLVQKMAFLVNIFSQIADKATLAKFIVATYPAQIAQARAANIALPPDVASQISPILPTVAGVSTATGLATNLAIGARGSDVVDLQTFLIIQNKGPAAVKLAYAGATGYFGTLTRDALAEYQASTATAAPAKMTREQILSKIAQIQALILSLQQQLKQLQAAT